MSGKKKLIRNFLENQIGACKEQIRAYKNDYKSKFSRTMEDSDVALRKINPIDRVWVLNPTHCSDRVIDRRNEGIKFVQLISGQNCENIVMELKKA